MLSLTAHSRSSPGSSRSLWASFASSRRPLVGGLFKFSVVCSVCYSEVHSYVLASYFARNHSRHRFNRRLLCAGFAKIHLFHARGRVGSGGGCSPSILPAGDCRGFLG